MILETFQRLEFEVVYKLCISARILRISALKHVTMLILSNYVLLLAWITTDYK